MIKNVLKTVFKWGSYFFLATSI